MSSSSAKGIRRPNAWCVEVESTARFEYLDIPDVSRYGKTQDFNIKSISMIYIKLSVQSAWHDTTLHGLAKTLDMNII
jgi:hypothetical protein